MGIDYQSSDKCDNANSYYIQEENSSKIIIALIQSEIIMQKRLTERLKSIKNVR